MPKIEISFQDLCTLVGKQLPKEGLADTMMYAKVEMDEIKGDIIKADCKDTNRPDLWCTEGIAREIKARFGKKSIAYKISKGKNNVIIDTKSPVQPFAVGMIVKNIKLNNNSLSQMIQLQDKLAAVLGAGRRNMSIGVYDLDKIKFPIKYTSLHSTEIKFVPLNFQKEMYAEEIMLMHPKGKEFGHILDGTDIYPVWIDANKKILSMVPVINSNDAGSVSSQTKNLFVECTGNDLSLLKVTINALAAQMLDREGSVESIVNVYGKTKVVTPELIPKKFSASLDYLRAISGMKLTDKKIVTLLEKSNYIVKSKNKTIELSYPGYRNDIMHPRDVAEDMMITYGYNKIPPVEIKFGSMGRLDELEEFCDKLADIVVGAGFQEILSYTLTNKNSLFQKMNFDPQDAAEIENPASANWSVFRNSLLPGLLEFFALNKHVEYPQKIFEIGKCIFLSDGETRSKDVKHIALGISSSDVNYDLIASNIDAVIRNLGLKCQLKKLSHPSFIEGRCAEILISEPTPKASNSPKRYGLLGEIHPQVLNNWNLEKPVLIAELNATELFYLLE
ncbi:MAG: phenylalanine--tRNA ligase subunit beta [Candidatus Aenigmarchaeota archaeon]|nr:phenylalanine--tRNA ligase subunit beta [Candidatus Aenigmarchaeota archaeon]